MVLKRGLFFLSLIALCASVFAAPWDPLRTPVVWVDLIEPAIMWILLIFSFVLFAISLLALRKKASSRLRWVGAAFGLFFIKSLLIVLDQYASPGNFFNYSLQGFFDFLIMGSFFVALFRK